MSHYITFHIIYCHVPCAHFYSFFLYTSLFISWYVACCPDCILHAFDHQVACLCIHMHWEITALYCIQGARLHSISLGCIRDFYILKRVHSTAIACHNEPTGACGARSQVRSWAQHQGDRHHILGKQDALPSNQQHKGQAPGIDAQVTRMKLHAQGRRLHAQCPWINVQCTSMNHNAFGCRTIQMPLSASGLQNAVHDFMHL